MTNFIEKHFVALMFTMAIIPCVMHLIIRITPVSESATIKAEQDMIIRAYAEEAYQQIMNELE
jgi:hypothetical protein